jgi:phosphoribosylaminoimidazolecarboxamide formyltransferase/IMP cyclohydrolase
LKSLQPTSRQCAIRGATLTQDPNSFVPKFPEEWDRKLIEDMCLAWGICASSTSNCITIANDRRMVANAVGQPCRTGACELALLQAAQAGHTANLKGAAVASDSFFAFADGIDMLARKKVRAIFATNGSMYDREVAEHARQFDTIFHTVPDREGRVFAGH